MLKITPASFDFDYAAGGMRCGPASKILGSENKDLFDPRVPAVFKQAAEGEDFGNCSKQ